VGSSYINVCSLISPSRFLSSLPRPVLAEAFYCIGIARRLSQQSEVNQERKIPYMEDKPTKDMSDIPASLRRPKKEPEKAIQVRIAFSQWRELTALAREYDQTVSAFIREAIEDWLRRARKARQLRDAEAESSSNYSPE
jgi:hypothetical protein